MSSGINQKISLSKPSFWQVIRCMSTSRLLIQGLPDRMDDTSLREAFEKYREVVEARAKAFMEFGVVAYSSTAEASAAVQALRKQQLPGRLVIVSYDDGDGGFKGGNFGSGGGKESNSIGVADEDTSQDDSLGGSYRDDDDDDIPDEDLLEGSYCDDDDTRNNYGDRRLKRYLDIFDR